MTFNTINIPTAAKRTGETNEQTFCRIMETWKGEYDNEWAEYTHAELGEWIMTYDKRFKNNTFPCAWIEDDNGNMTEYFIFYKRGKEKILRHQTVEI